MHVDTGSRLSVDQGVNSPSRKSRIAQRISTPFAFFAAFPLRTQNRDLRPKQREMVVVGGTRSGDGNGDDGMSDCSGGCGDLVMAMITVEICRIDNSSANDGGCGDESIGDGTFQIPH